MSCGVGRRRGSDLVLLWLWYRPAATALIRPLAWEPPYAAGAALEKTKKKKIFRNDNISNNSNERKGKYRKIILGSKRIQLTTLAGEHMPWSVWEVKAPLLACFSKFVSLSGGDFGLQR